MDEWIAPEKDMVKPKPGAAFDSSQTDFGNYTELGFLTTNSAELNMGLTFILRQSFPRWMVKILEAYEPPYNNTRDYTKRPVSVLDARTRSQHLSFHDAGFTLIDMKDDQAALRSVNNWRSQTDIKPFQDALEPHVRKLYPEATRIEFTYNVVRGGSQFGDQPAAINAPHLDYTQNDTARTLFHERYPTLDQAKEQAILLGQRDTDQEELEVLLGIWKPIGMTSSVCNHPLAVMDARTFSTDQEALHPIHIDFGAVKFHNLNGAIRYHDSQQWYYFPSQTNSEVLVFTQYSRDRHFCNPHASLEISNCPADSDHRVSVEMRAAVFQSVVRVAIDHSKDAYSFTSVSLLAKSRITFILVFLQWS